MSNVRPRLPDTSRSASASVSRPKIPALPQSHPPMSRPWQHCAGHTLGHRRASVAWSARAVRPSAASARATVFQGFCAPALPGKVSALLSAFSRRASPVIGAPELISLLVSRKVGAMRPIPNPNTRYKVSTRVRCAAVQPGCAFGSVSARPLPVAGFGIRGRPNPSFKRTRLRRSA